MFSIRANGFRRGSREIFDALNFFFPHPSPLFKHSLQQSNINLPFTPSSLTLTRNLLPYFFISKWGEGESILFHLQFLFSGPSKFVESRAKTNFYPLFLSVHHHKVLSTQKYIFSKKEKKVFHRKDEEEELFHLLHEEEDRVLTSWKLNGLSTNHR